VGRGKRCL